MSKPRVGKWDNKSTGMTGGIIGGPIGVFDEHGNTTIVLSPYSKFMASSYARHADENTPNSIAYGVCRAQPLLECACMSTLVTLYLALV